MTAFAAESVVMLIVLRVLQIMRGEGRFLAWSGCRALSQSPLPIVQVLNLVVVSVMGTWSSVDGMVSEISLRVCMVI